MAAYITTTDIDAAITQVVREALFDDDSGNTFLDDLIAKGSGLVKQAAHRAGYTTLGDTTTSQQVKTAALAQFLALAFQRKQQKLPEEYFEAFNMTERIRLGQLPLTDYTASTVSGVGGAKFSETNSSVTDARYNVFARSKLNGIY